MKIFIIFGNAQILQIDIFWKLLKMTFFKPCEQMMYKTFYFETTKFVEPLHVKGSLLKFSPIFLKRFSALIKSSKVLLFFL
jgi:hypothetical protein